VKPYWGKLLAILALCLAGVVGSAGGDPPQILRISPTGGPEGTRVEIYGSNLADATAVLFGKLEAVFKVVSAEKLIAIVPNRAPTSLVTVTTPDGRASSPFAFAVLIDRRVPDEVKFRSGYVNTDPRPVDFSSAMWWGIAVADVRAAGFEAATVEISWMRLSCRVDGKDFTLNEDRGRLRGGLFRRNPWFGTNEHEPMPLDYDHAHDAVVLRVGRRPDKVWHFWSASPRAALPPGRLEGCTVKAYLHISSGALVQMGMDYWKNPTAQYGPGNSHEAGASNWYFPSESWQEAVFTDMGGQQF
jgi:hypothetical protein